MSSSRHMPYSEADFGAVRLSQCYLHRRMRCLRQSHSSGCKPKVRSQCLARAREAELETYNCHHLTLQTKCCSQDGRHHHHPRGAQRTPEAATDHIQLHADVHDQQGLRRPVCDLQSGEPPAYAAVHCAAESAQSCSRSAPNVLTRCSCMPTLAICPFDIVPP